MLSGVFAVIREIYRRFSTLSVRLERDALVDVTIERAMHGSARKGTGNFAGGSAKAFGRISE
jgi:hypothetical protein